MAPPRIMRVRVGDPVTGPVSSFEQSGFSVGSDPTNDLVLPDASVPAKGLSILDDARSGTYILWNELTRKGTEFGEGQVFRVGIYDLRMLDGEPPAAGEEAAFLAALEHGPSDDEVRAVYADWLEEKGRAREAEILRAQIAIRGLSADDPRFLEMSGRVRELAVGLGLGWRRTVARPPIENCAVRFEASCPKAWDALTPTGNPNERHCGTCGQTVYYAPTILIARYRVARGDCVAVDIVLPRAENDVVRPPTVRSIGVVARPPDFDR